MNKNTTLSGCIYLGPVFEMFDGKLTKLYAYMVSGERRFALTEEAARASVAKLAR